MPDENNTNTPTPTNQTPDAVAKTNTTDSSVIVDPNISGPTNGTPAKTPTPSKSGTIPDIINKINDSQNVLIALSSDPSVDEMATAIGLSLYLDKLGKHATAIYSGKTPNTLEFLKPEETFEATVDALQDFIIALSKEKADHLRYKLDGEFVKIYITPYKTKIAKEDLEFSYGDFNVDLVLALNVSNGVDLDSALREHGRIMHDASIINITTGNPGKFGEIEWSDKNASSIAEMISSLLYQINSEIPLGKEEATALLTGIVAATDRFSNTKTSPETMQLSSRLMESGANQQLISKNVTPDAESKLIQSKEEKDSTTKEGPESIKDNKESETKNEEKVEPEAEKDPTTLSIEHSEGDDSETESRDEKSDTKVESAPEEKQDEEKQVEELTQEEVPAQAPAEASAEAPAGEPAEAPKTKTAESSPSIETPPELVDDLKAAEASLSKAGAEAVPEPIESPVKIEDIAKEEKVVQPPSDFIPEVSNGEEQNKYGQMFEDALKGIGASDNVLSPVEQPVASANPAAAATPAVPANPEINGVPSINYMPMPGEEILPPPPTPPVDFSTTMPDAAPVVPTPAPIEPIAPATPVVQPNPEPLGSQPAMQDQVYAPQATDPSAFKIPGM